MEKSIQLHSLNLPPQLTWGTQKVLRCMNIDPISKDVSEEEEEDLISETQEKPMMEYQSDVEKMRKSVPNSKILKSTRARRNIEKKKERPKFSIALSWKEIEDDFISMTGNKPPRRPSKQSKSHRMMLDVSIRLFEFMNFNIKSCINKCLLLILQDVFPGSQLHEVNRDRYKVKKNGTM